MSQTPTIAALRMPLVKESLPRAGWRVPEWADATGISRGSVYNLFLAKKINSVKCGKSRIITTSPAEFLASLPSA